MWQISINAEPEMIKDGRMYFIGNFQHVSDQQAADEKDRRHGNFSMMVEADAMNEALDKFRQRLTDLKETTSFFDGECTIYITQLGWSKICLNSMVDLRKVSSPVIWKYDVWFVYPAKTENIRCTISIKVC